MLQNHHALSKYDEIETRSAIRVHSIKRIVLLGETMNSNINVPFILVHYFRNTVNNLRIQANHISLSEIMHRYSWGTLKLKIM